MQCQQMLHRRQCFSSGSLPKASSGLKAFSGGSLQQQHRSRHQLQCAAAATLTGCKLVGVGSSVPSTVLSNADLEKFVETNDEWIASRTGIRRRHVLAEGETMGSHAAAACKKALEMAGIAAEDVSIVLVATSTPDDAFGSACQVRNPVTHICAGSTSPNVSSAVFGSRLLPVIDSPPTCYARAECLGFAVHPCSCNWGTASQQWT
jgi:3-oxoacyl-[acyl-carrier-protein] synthase-3